MKKIITITGKTDGFGSQYQAFMSGIAYCYQYNLLYKHTPMTQIEHCDEAEKLNEFIGLKSDEEDLGEPDEKMIFPYEVHWCSNPDLYFIEEVLEKIRNMYFSTTKSPDCPYDIAIHIRRGDVTKIGLYNERYTSNEEYVSIINKLKKNHPNHSICIYSEGKEDDFELLKGENIFFNLNDSIENTFHSLVTAKVLVTSKSSYSYSAAYLSKGIIYYMNFWHKPFKNWFIL